MTSVLTNGEIWTQTCAHKGELSYEDESRDQGGVSTSQRGPKVASKPLKASGEPGKRFCLTKQPCDALISDF